MILDNTAALDVIIKRPHKKQIDFARSYTKKLLMHIKGIGVDQYLERIMAFERADIIEIRKKYAVSNKAMFSRVNRPLDKIFSAKGGSTYLNLPEAQTVKFKKKLNNVYMGYSLKQWMEIFWMPALGYDPMGVILMEVDQDGIAYPTYKSILDIYEYKLNGRDLEYIIFKNQKTLNSPAGLEKVENDKRIDEAVEAGKAAENQIFRIVDDASDRLVMLTGNNLVDIPGETYPNYWLQVPAKIISSNFDPVRGIFLSTDDDVIELADQFLREGSIKNLFKNYFGFPRAWEYQSPCPECEGLGSKDGKPCTFCKGTAIKSKSDPSETIRLPVPKSKDQPLLAPEVAGYVTPDIEGWKMMSEELDLLEDIIFQTKWGTHMQDDSKKGGEKETATGRFIDVQPVNDKLNKFSIMEETMETFIVDMLGQIEFGASYKGANVTAGRRYMIETPDEIWQKLEDARKNGAPTSALYDLYNDYLQSRYQANSMEMTKYLKLAKIEPLPFVKYEDLGKLQTFPDVILRKKFYYEGWVNSKADSDILLTDLKALQADFEAYCVAQDTQLEADVQKNKTINGVEEPEPAAPGAKKPVPAAA